MSQTNIVNDCKWAYWFVWFLFVRTLLLKYHQSSWISFKQAKGFFQLNKIKMDLVGFLFCFHFYYIPPGLVLLSSEWPDCQAPASDWSILAVGKYLRYLWLFTSSVCYKTIEKSYNKINKTRQITSDSAKICPGDMDVPKVTISYSNISFLR